ncbi:MAG: type II toxin-antitoxin system ParD family antitoxin [Steroidobacteraceae bacterium]
MSRVTSFSLGDHFTRFVNAQLDAGRYSNASDLMRAALRLLEEREMRIAALRAALIEGEQSGVSTPFDVEAYITRKRKTVRKSQRKSR